MVFTIKNGGESNETSTSILNEKPSQPKKSIHRDWFTHQAILLSQMRTADPATQNRLKLALLHSYSKISTMSEKEAEKIGFQSSPFLPEDCRYHRNTRNDLITRVDEAYARDLGVKAHELHLIDSPLLSEVFEREFPQEGLNLNITHLENFEVLVEELLKRARLNQFPEQRVLINISPLLLSRINELEKCLMKKIKELPAEINKEIIADNLLSKLHLVCFTEHKQQNILLTPEFLLNSKPSFDDETNALIKRKLICNRHGTFDRLLNSMMCRNGYRVCPAQAKAAWLKVSALETIFEEVGIPQAHFSTPSPIPQVCQSYQQFLRQPLVDKFRALSTEKEAPPYLKVMPEATVRLLEGFLDYDQTRGIHREYEARGIKDLIQISYFRMHNAMREAIFKKNNFVAFHNQIELIHQEIQDLLAILEPHDSTVLSKSISRKFAPFLQEPQVFLKASAMHGFSSTLSSVEKQKKSNQLNVAVLQGSYYHQSDESLKEAKTYQVSVLEGDSFISPPKGPIDLFVTEFHHNIQKSKLVYQPEDVLGQVKRMFSQKLVAEKFTVLIDTTIDLEVSEDVRNFLDDAKIQELIRNGKLNIVFTRSAQKFDMLGMDNYYGGILTTFNDKKSFKKFNKRMRLSTDQLSGLCYQGLAHLQKYAGDSLDRFRREMMKNTQKIYKKLPTQSIYAPGSTNPVQISRIEDVRMFFLDIKFPNYPKTNQAFRARLAKFVGEKQLPFVNRASFGFNHTTYTIIDGIKYRFNLGLDSDKTIDTYAQFFQAIQHTIDQVKILKTMTVEEHDLLVSQSISRLDV